MNIIRFKLFKIKLFNSKPCFQPAIDSEAAALMRNQEQKLLGNLRKSNKKFRYIKLIPDELPEYFWGIKPRNATKKYLKNLKKASRVYAPETEIFTISGFLKDSELKKLYDSVYKNVYSSFDNEYNSVLVNKKMFEAETQKRSTYYSDSPLVKDQAQELARKAFALFAAEAALIYQLEKTKVFPNLYLLGRDDKVDLYKYEFLKFPKGRPPFKKLFVI